jgi:L-asparaginase
VSTRSGQRSRIRFLAFGGTIASVRRPGMTEVTPSLSGAELVESIPELAAVADVEVREFPPIASFAVTTRAMLDLARAVIEAHADGCDGVVISHGTDTIEETAYALALMLPRERRLVLTGAMRNPTLPGTDGPANLIAAFLAAGSRLVTGVGPVVVLNDDLHAARFATKTHTSRVSTIGSPGAGPLGGIVEGRVDVWWRPAWEDHLGLPDALDGRDVELVRVAADVSDALLRAAAERRPAGIVIEGTGGGHVPPPLLPVLDDIVAAGIPVVLASRTAAGPNLESTYRMPGGETDLIERGAIPAGWLSGHKARLRLLVGLALDRDARALFPVR